MTPKARSFWPLLFVVFLTDCATKDLAVTHLLTNILKQLVDSFVRLTLVHNPDMAFGFDLHAYVGEWARPLLIAGMATIFVAMLVVYYRSAPRQRMLGAALGLVSGGAAGNMFDRVRFPLGVVDFIDVGIGEHRFWVFNVADAAILVGAVVLALVLWRDDAVTVVSG